MSCFLVFVDKQTALFVSDLFYSREADCRSFLFTFMTCGYTVCMGVKKSVGIIVAKFI